MELYIHGAGIMSAVGDNGSETFLQEAPIYDTNMLLCKEPDYTGYIAPMQMRRMSKAVKMGVVASKICMRYAGVEKPDAVSAGTALGCLYDTEQFLSKMVMQDEQMLTPTSFIQSTHNTVAGQIALLAGCHGHNLTYVQRGHSFEHAVVNAELYLDEHPGEQMLVGGIDELTDTSYAILKMSGIYSGENRSADNVLTDTAKGSIAGEGASFLLIDKEARPGALHIRGLSAFVARETEQAIEKVLAFMMQQGIHAADIDMVMLGMNGDERSEPFYNSLRESIFKGNAQGCFKHLSGEYATASAFGLALVWQMQKNKAVPSYVALNKEATQMKNIFMVNSHGHHYSCWHLQAV